MKNLIWIILMLASSAVLKATDRKAPQTVSSAIKTIAPHLHIDTLTVKPNAASIQLKWTVKETAQLQYFLIEHAADGQQFIPLSEIPVQSQQHTYFYTDTQLKTNTVSYRVKAVYATVVVELPVRRLAVPAS